MKLSNKNLLLSILLLFNFNSTAYAENFHNYYQTPELKAPDKGSVAGSLASPLFVSDDLTHGSLPIPLKLEFPTDRGPLFQSFTPSYRTTAGLSEWGAGFKAEMSIFRFNDSRDIDFKNDDLMSPWGQLKKGSDGYWYPLGLAKRVRVSWATENSIEAYLENGVTLVFDWVLQGSHGVYAWYLSQGYDLVGNRNEYIYHIEGQNGLPVLKTILYGGKNLYPAYRIDFGYDRIDMPWFEFRSGIKYFLNQRIKTIEILSKDRNTLEFQKLWSYDFTFYSDTQSPRFYLTAVQRTFASGVKEPSIQFDYEYPRASFEHITWKEMPEYEAVAKKYYSDFYIPVLGSVRDPDATGIPEIEVNKTLEVIKRVGDQIIVEPGKKGTEKSPYVDCQSSYGGRALPRRFARFFGPQDELRSVLLARKNTWDTQVVLCDRNGKITHEAFLRDPWSFGPNVQLVDLNHDGKPDLIRISGGREVTVMENVSTTETGIQFVERNRFQTNTSGDVLATWVQDLNGDGIVDLIIMMRTGLFVFWGKGNFEFEHEGEFLGLWHAASQTHSKFGDTAAFSFVDFNQDGLADLIVSGSRESFFFLNQVQNPGGKPRMLEVPFQVMRGQYGAQTYPQYLDLAGTGNPQLVMSLDGRVYSAELAGPGTGLMKSVSDGKGNQSTFEYARAASEKGIKSRPSVLKRIQFKSMGEGVSSFEFDFSGAQFHSQTHHFSGFESVSVQQKNHLDEPILLKQLKFLFSDFSHALLSSKSETDPRLSTITHFQENNYVESNGFGLPILSLGKSQIGIKSSAGNTNSVDTQYRYDVNQCLANKQVTSIHGTLTESKDRFESNSLKNFPHCLENSLTESGNHSDSNLDFMQVVRVDRNHLGLPVSLVSGLTRIAELGYDSQFNLIRTYTPKEGPITYTYSDSLLTDVTDSSGKSISAFRDPIRDVILSMNTELKGDHYLQGFQYDEWNRLQARWDNHLFGSSAYPLISYDYRFADFSTVGRITQNTRVDSEGATGYKKDLFFYSGSGSELGIASQASDQADQWVVKHLKSLSDLQTDTSLYKTQLRSFEPAHNLTPEELLGESTLIDKEKQTTLGLPLENWSTVQTGTTRHQQIRYEVLGSGLQETHIENSKTEKRILKSLDHKPLSYQDESGRTTQFTYDALGRLRRIDLPDQSKHTIDYDAVGNPVKIVRSGVGTIQLSYTSDGLLENRTQLDPSGEKIGDQDITHDEMGRVTNRLNKLKSSGLLPFTAPAQSYHYFYDGKTHSNGIIPGQAGQLTSVVGPEFKKEWTYQKNGQLAQTTFDFTDWKTFTSSHTYRSDGLLKQTRTLIQDKNGNKNLELVLTYSYDSLGRMRALLLNDKPIYHLEYDPFSKIKTVRLESSTESVTLDRDDTTFNVKAIHRKSPDRSFDLEWVLNERGLIDRERYSTHKTEVIQKKYEYTSEGFLRSDGENQFVYDISGLLTPSGTFASPPLIRDALGRVVEKEGKRFLYGASGRIEEVQEGGGKKLAQYSYDENSVRVLKKKEGKIVEAYVDGKVLTTDAYIEPIAVDGFYLGVIYAKVGQVEFRSLWSDSRGSIVQNASGNLTVPTPYGIKGLLDRDLSSVAIDYAMTGYDPDLGAYRAQARDYDPILGQFLTPDPLFLEHPDKCLESHFECNLFGYAKGNPISFVDPTGMYSEPHKSLGSNQIVIDGFIEHKTTHVWQGDNRWFGQPSSLDQSRLTIHVDTVTGQMQQHVSPSHLSFMNRDFKPLETNNISIAGGGNMYEIRIHASNSAAPSFGPSIDNTIQLMKNSQGEWQSRMIGDAFPSWEVNHWNGNSRQPLMESLSSGNSFTGPLYLIDGTTPRVINYGQSSTQNFIP